jgi:hypothetical protein
MASLLTGEPQFRLQEVERFSLTEGNRSISYREVSSFDLATWNVLVANNGRFPAIGVTLEEEGPIEISRAGSMAPDEISIEGVAKVRARDALCAVIGQGSVVNGDTCGTMSNTKDAKEMRKTWKLALAKYRKLLFGVDDETMTQKGGFTEDEVRTVRGCCGKADSNSVTALTGCRVPLSFPTDTAPAAPRPSLLQTPPAPPPASPDASVPSMFLRW